MKKIHLYLVLITHSLGFFSFLGNAKNLMKIATIGSVTLYMDLSMTYQQKVDAIKKFLRGQITHVLPYHPDLIVLPETCDRPHGMKAKEQYEYFEVRRDQFLDFLSNIASKNRCYIALGMNRPYNVGIWRNSSVMLDRNG